MGDVRLEKADRRKILALKRRSWGDITRVMRMSTSMKHVFSIAFLLILNFALKSQHNTLNTIEEKEGWILLFDGKTTDAWRGFDKKTFPEKGWEVRDENLVITYSGTEEEGSAGDIVTHDKFENFELRLEFMLTDSANSGIFYMVREFNNAPIWHHAPEYQILDNPTYESCPYSEVELWTVKPVRANVLSSE